MGLWRKTPATTAAAPTATAGAALPAGVALHVMPKALLDRPATLPTPPVPIAAPAPVPPPVSPATPTPVLPPVPKPLPPRRRSPLLFVGIALIVVLGGGGAAVWWTLSQPAVVPEPTPVPTPVPTPTPTPTPMPTPVVPTPGTDTDSDGLTNVEETLYGTDLRNPDTDGDTYLDGNEVFHRYDPHRPAPSTLQESGATTVRRLLFSEQMFQIEYPRSWNVETEAEVDGPPYPVTFRSTDRAGISLDFFTLTADVTLDGWYAARTDLPRRSSRGTMTTKEGYAAIASADDRTVVVRVAPDLVAIFTYTLPPDSGAIEYLQTFQMMVNSLRR